MITTLNITRGDKKDHNSYEVVREAHCDHCGAHISTKWNAYCNELETILDENCFNYFNQNNGDDLWYTFCSEKCREKFLEADDRKYKHCFPEIHAQEKERQRAIKMRHDKFWKSDMVSVGYWPHDKDSYSPKWTRPDLTKISTYGKLKWFLRKR